MGLIGEVFPYSVPSIGTAGPTYATTINNILNELIARVQSQVPPAGLDTTEGLDMQGTQILNVEGLALYTVSQLADISALPLGSIARYASNLYYNDASGVVQITNGAAVNAATTGGIVGDYGTSGRLVSYVDASETYEFYDNQALTQWARLKARALDVVDEATGRMAQITVPAAITATYSLVLPASLPGTTQCLALTSAGQLQVASTAAVAQFSVNAQGLKHTDRTQWQPVPFDNHQQSGTWSRTTGTNVYSVPTAGTLDIYFHAPPTARRLKQVITRVQLAGTLTNTCTVNVYRHDTSTTAAAPGASLGTNNTTSTGAWVSLTTTCTDTVAANHFYRLRVAFTTTGVPTLYEIFGFAPVWDYV